jgi:Predicted acetyltransferase
MNIRPENERDFKEIYDLVETAFESAKVKSGDEQNFIDRLRAGSGYVPELALVAEDGGRLIGHIMLTEAQLWQGGEGRTVLMLAPLSVLPESRKAGVGAALVNEALSRGRNKWYEAVFLVGDPAYYSRFGFQSAAEFGIKPSLDIPAQYVQVFELIPGALGDQAGALIELAT